jgi:competence/damage-inducible protein CinA-like protein
MPVAEIIAIGTELLLGETQDTNTHFIARKLRNAGIDLFRIMMIGDNIDRIAGAIQEALKRSDIIITTGGLGPTVDDPTRLAVAHALDVDLEFHPELWEQIHARFKRMDRPFTENNRRQAFIPAGSTAIENPVGTAPSFIASARNRLIICLPGVPREMEFLLENAVLPYILKHFELHSVIKTLTLHTSGISESQIDELIGDLERQKNPTIGLAAHLGQIDIRITVKSESEEKADKLLKKQSIVIENRLGENIFGKNSDSLAGIVAEKFRQLGLKISLIECGMKGKLIQAMNQANIPLDNLSTFANQYDSEKLEQLVMQASKGARKSCLLGVSLVKLENKQTLFMVFKLGSKTHKAERTYGDTTNSAILWALNIILDFIRRIL